MDWKLFPSTQASVYYQENSQQSRISMERLCDNLEALLRRDKRDCLSKQLHGLLNSAGKHEVRLKAGIQRTPTSEKLKDGSDLERAGKCSSVKEEYSEKLSRKYLNTEATRELADSKASCSRDGKYKSGINKTFYAKEPRPISTKFLSGKCKKRGQIQMNLEIDKSEIEVLPSNGWWLEQRSSDSETESDLDIDCSASLNLNTNSNDFGSSTSICSSIKNGRRSLVVSKNGHSGAEYQGRKDSFSSQLSEDYKMLTSEQGGEKDCCNFFELTSGTGDEEVSFSAVPSPPSTSPVVDDKGSEFRSNSGPSSLSLSQPLYNAHDKEIFDDNLSLEYRELLQHHPNTTSRITYTTLKTSYGYNYAFQGIGRIIEEYNRSRGILETRNKTHCALPKVNNKKTTTDHLGNAHKRRPNTATLPVILKLTNRNKSGVSGKLTANKDTDERVLPTTLNKSAEASYSIMTPYMANIVWSVMEDEKVQ